MLIQLTCFLVFSYLRLCACHMSMSFPVPRDTGRISKSDCTSPKRSWSYLTWEWNEPMIPARPCVCHATFPDPIIRSSNKFQAGQPIDITLAGSAYHGGGHCSFWWSSDERTWKKIVDINDCTTMAVNNQRIRVTLPQYMDTACASRCVLAWTWIPAQSGTCEVYMTCADIQVSGAAGGVSIAQTMDFNALIAPGNPTCMRVDPTTHWSQLFSQPLQNNISPNSPSVANAPISATARPTLTQTKITGTNAPIGTFCTNPASPPVGNIDRQTGRCGGSTGFGCDIGMCCSQAGFCGPELDHYDANGVAIYKLYVGDTVSTYSSASLAFSDYCNNNQGDWRLVECCAIINGAYDESLVGCGTVN